jgi:hypothetical protein
MNYKRKDEIPLCSEEGQLIYSNGTYIVDRSCQCDYTKGYVFAKPPLHQCYCVPSREECGCLLKQCPNASIELGLWSEVNYKQFGHLGDKYI